MDGITTSVSIFILLVCLSFMATHGQFNTFDFIAILGVIGSLIGFLFHNWNPSKMFMGDTGSQFLGLFISFMSIKYIWNSTLIDHSNTEAQQISVVLVALIIPIVDTTSVVINRIARKKSPFVGGTDHTTHHLSFLGLRDDRIGFLYLGVHAISLAICTAIFRFVEEWSHWHTLGCLLYFTAIFGTLYTITQFNKDKRV